MNKRLQNLRKTGFILRLFVLTFFILSQVNTIKAQDQSQNIIKLTADKTEYYSGEKITLTAKVDNSGYGNITKPNVKITIPYENIDILKYSDLNDLSKFEKTVYSTVVEKATTLEDIENGNNLVLDNQKDVNDRVKRNATDVPDKIQVIYNINHEKKPAQKTMVLTFGGSNDTGRLAGFDEEGKIVNGNHFYAGWKPYFVYADTETVFYKWDHWNTEAGDNGTRFEGGQKIKKEEIKDFLKDGKLELFAQYTEHEIIHVTYHKNIKDKAAATNKKELLIGVDYIKEYPEKADGRLPGNTTHTEVYSAWEDATHVLDSWNTQAYGKGTKFEIASRPTKDDIEGFLVDGKLNLYAQYVKTLPEKITVDYYVNHKNYVDKDPVFKGQTIKVGATDASGRLPGTAEDGIMYHSNHFYSGNPQWFKYMPGDKFVKHIGWNTQAGGKGLGFKAGQPITKADIELSDYIDATGKLKLYSVWELVEDEKVLKYHENGQAIGKSDWKGVKYQTSIWDGTKDVFNGINAAGTNGAFHFNGTHGFLDDSGYRFVAWNTEPDGSGTWYRGGQKIPADLKEVYAQYDKPENILNLINNANASLKAQIYINGSSGHNSKDNPFKIVKNIDDIETRHLYYRAELIPDRKLITTLWGRLDRVQKYGEGEIHVKGKLVIEFDKNLVLPGIVEVSFTSGFYVPDPDHEKFPTGTKIETNGFVNTFEYAVGEGIHSIEIPVKMVSPEKIDEMSYEEFMQPMHLTVKGKEINKNEANKKEGIKTDIPDKEYRKIVKENNGFIEVKGKIGTEIHPIGFSAVGFETDVAPQYAHLALTIKATKAWAGGPTEKPTVWFKLYRNIVGGDLEAVPVTEAPIKELPNGTTKVEWENITTTDASGNDYIFSVKEVNAEGVEFTPENYTATEGNLANKYIVTNTYESPKIDITATKVWLGGTAESHVEVELVLKNGTSEVGAQKANKANNWTVTWKVAKTDTKGKEITYTVKEVAVPTNYTAVVTGNQTDGFTVTNTYDGNSTGIQLVKGKIKIYPNPVVNMLHISSDTKIDRVELIDMTGKIVLRKELTQESELTLDLSSIVSGVYLIRVIEDRAYSIHKVIKR